jgi:heterodisulfide reductase subunit B
MCQFNLDAYQPNINKYFGTDFDIPILYFTQLMGLAMGHEPKELGIGKELVSAKAALEKIGVEPPPEPKKKRPAKGALPTPSLEEE